MSFLANGVEVSSHRCRDERTALLDRGTSRVLIEINKKVGFRLFTKFGTKGVINLGKLVPVVGGGLSAGINVATMRMVGAYARRNFPAVSAATEDPVEVVVLSE